LGPGGFEGKTKKNPTSKDEKNHTEVVVTENE